MDIISNLTRQILNFKSLFKGCPFELDIIQNMVKYIIENDMSSAFPDIVTACTIYLNILVIITTADRSFFKLNLVKCYYGKIILQDGLNYI